MPNPSPLEMAAINGSNGFDYKAALIASINNDKNKELVREGHPEQQILLQLPGQPVQPVQPQTAVTPPAGQPGPTPEQTQGNVTGASNTPRYANKFDTAEDMEQGYYQLLNFASELNRQLHTQQPPIMQMPENTPTPLMIPGSSPGSEPRVNPGARTPVDWKSNGAVVKFADKSAMPADDVAEFAQSIADTAISGVEQTVQQTLAPLQAQIAMDAADRHMAQRYPEYTRFAPEMVLYLQSADPTVQGTFAEMMRKSLYVGASEYLWAMFRSARQTAAHGQLVAQSQLAEGTRQTARANAAVSPSSPGTPIHAALGQDLGPDPQVLSNLREGARNGDGRAAAELRRLTFGRLAEQQANAQGFTLQ